MTSRCRSVSADAAHDLFSPIQDMDVLGFTDESSSLATDLHKLGKMIGNDLFIAAHARSQGLILVTKQIEISVHAVSLRVFVSAMKIKSCLLRQQRLRSKR
jgi:hypothetical protein